MYQIILDVLIFLARNSKQLSLFFSLVHTDRLESTILKITGKIFVVIYSLLFLDNSQENSLLFAKILSKNRLFSDITGCYLKIASYRWLHENNRLLLISHNRHRRSGPIVSWLVILFHLIWKNDNILSILRFWHKILNCGFHKSLHS